MDEGAGSVFRCISSGRICDVMSGLGCKTRAVGLVSPVIRRLAKETRSSSLESTASTKVGGGESCAMADVDVSGDLRRVNSGGYLSARRVLEKS